MKPCMVPGCVPHAWGHVGPDRTPHAPTDKKPYTARCELPCAICKGRACSKANGHEWSCNCHHRGCAPRYGRDGQILNPRGDSAPAGLRDGEGRP